ncbi:MAG: hypothetical protein IVW54_07185 [Candidatus Binataceae bacterium]|nr:hypothetical protein [Candidatus Binataceae bacterium]
MKIGTRLALALLIALTPVLVIYSYFNFHISSRVYRDNFQRETRATTRSLRAALLEDIKTEEWDQISSVLQQLRDQGTEAAIFKPNRSLWFALPKFPAKLYPPKTAFAVVDRRESWETDRQVGPRYWFCRLAPLSLSHQPAIGYIMVAENLTELREDNARRFMSSIAAAIMVLVMAAGIITLATRRYVTRPLAELSLRVSRFSSNEDDPDRALGRNEVELLTEEFRRLDAELIMSRERLLREHRRQLELERNLRHSDKLATIGMIASGLAHEIGSPMAVIRGRAEHLRINLDQPDKLWEGLGIIIAQIDRISSIVHRLLDYARRREPMRVRYDLRQIVMRALSLIETEVSRRNIRMVADLGSTPLIVDCDADQLQQVFVNLGLNALDAMLAQDDGLLYVSAAPLDNGQAGYMRVVFEDNGPGVPAENRPQIFDPFFTTKEPGRGTGMGLAVSQSIVQDHDGEITMEPREPHGARFFVTLPAAHGGEEQRQLQA